MLDNADVSIEIIVKYHGSLQKIRDEINTLVELLDENYAILTLPTIKVADLYRFNEIEYIELPKIVNVSLNKGIGQSCISPVQSNPLGLSGKGVIVGIIDSGIDCTHHDFRDSDGKSRILYLLDQETKTEYNQDQINRLLSEDSSGELKNIDVLSHGTAVAGIAAGNGRNSGGTYRGVAYEADIIAVKMGMRGYESFARTTEIMRAIKYLYDKATMLVKPLVINLSFGTNDGSHDGSSLFETYINEMSSKWKSCIIVASGNEGTGGHHYTGTVKNGQSIDVQFAVSPYLNSLYLTMWKDFADDVSLELFMPDGYSSGIIKENTVTSIEHRGSVVGIYHSVPVPYNRSHEVYFQFFSETGYIQNGIWRIRLAGRNIVSGDFDMWLPTTEQAGRETSFSVPDPNLTCTLPSTAAKVISVGGYNSTLGTFAEFSGRGGITGKPDIVAPAISIMTTKAGGGYDMYTGTSMAAPFVTGAAALMMQWGIVNENDPFLYGERLKAFLQKGAARTTGITYPNPLWGYGKLCLSETMNLMTGGLYGKF